MRKAPSKKMYLVFVFCFMVTLLVLIIPGTARAGVKPSLSKKTVKMKQGKTVILKVRHASRKVKWTTTNRKIARVKKTKGKRKQTAVIKAGKKAGTCYIKAKVGKRKLKCKIVVKKKKKNTTSTRRPSPTKPTKPTEREIKTRPLSDSSRDLTAGLTAILPETKVPTESFIKGFAGFSIDLLKKALESDRAAGKKDNVLISPDSVTTALAMTENGAAGQTLTEMENVLCNGISADDYNQYLSGINRRLMASDALIYNVSNSIWAREDKMEGLVREDFLQTNKNYHDAQFYLAPFNAQTVEDMNAWVYNKSRNMIDKIISELSNDARMVLINTVAFEGQWIKPFTKSEKTEPFTAYDKSTQSVTMLRDRGEYQYLELNGGKGFVKNYGSNQKPGQVAFVGILPPENMDADTYIQTLDGASFIESWNNKKEKNVAITMPAFQTDYSVEMGGLLQNLGIRTAFTDAADFSRMAAPSPDTPGLKISKVLHKTHIELDENGTKAAAATAVIMEKNTAIIGNSPIELTFDRPFVYALVDTATGIPLFIGEVRTITN